MECQTIPSTEAVASDAEAGRGLDPHPGCGCRSLDANATAPAAEIAPRLAKRGKNQPNEQQLRRSASWGSGNSLGSGN